MRLNNILTISFCSFFIFIGNSFAAEFSRDSSAMAEGGFVEQMQTSEAILIHGPLDEEGNFIPEESEVRVYNGNVDVATESQAKRAWQEAKDISDVPVLTREDIERDIERGDSSTYGFYGASQGFGARGYGYGSGLGFYGNQRLSGFGFGGYRGFPGFNRGYGLGFYGNAGVCNPCYNPCFGIW